MQISIASICKENITRLQRKNVINKRNAKEKNNETRCFQCLREFKQVNKTTNKFKNKPKLEAFLERN